MSHLSTEYIHGYRNRAAAIRVDVETSADPGDFTAIAFRVSTVAKTGLSASAGGNGVIVDLTITATEMDGLAEGVHEWECIATVASEVRTLARGWFRVDAEIT